MISMTEDSKKDVEVSKDTQTEGLLHNEQQIYMYMSWCGKQIYKS
jgi:hypothetical protein